MAKKKNPKDLTVTINLQGLDDKVTTTPQVDNLSLSDDRDNSTTKRVDIDESDSFLAVDKTEILKKHGGSFYDANTRNWNKFRQVKLTDWIGFLIPVVIFLVDIVVDIFRATFYFKEEKYVYFAITLFLITFVGYLNNLVYCEKENCFESEKTPGDEDICCNCCTGKSWRMIGLTFPIIQIWRLIPNWIRTRGYQRDLPYSMDSNTPKFTKDMKTVSNYKKRQLNEVDFALNESFVESFPQTLLQIHLIILNYETLDKSFLTMGKTVLLVLLIPWVLSAVSLATYDGKAKEYLQALHYQHDREHTTEWKFEKESIVRTGFKFVFHFLTIGCRLYLLASLSIAFDFWVILFMIVLALSYHVWVQFDHTVRPRFQYPVDQKSTVFSNFSNRLVNVFAFHGLDKTTKNLLIFHGLFAFYYFALMYFGEIFSWHYILPESHMYELGHFQTMSEFFAHRYIPIIIFGSTILITVPMTIFGLFFTSRPSISPLEISSFWKDHFEPLTIKNIQDEKTQILIKKTITCLLTPYDEIRKNIPIWPFSLGKFTQIFEQRLHELWEMHCSLWIDCPSCSTLENVERALSEMDSAVTRLRIRDPLAHLIYSGDIGGLIKSLVLSHKRRLERMLVLKNEGDLNGEQLEELEVAHNSFHMMCHVFEFISRIFANKRFTGFALSRFHIILSEDQEDGFDKAITCL